MCVCVWGGGGDVGAASVCLRVTYLTLCVSNMLHFFWWRCKYKHRWRSVCVYVCVSVSVCVCMCVGACGAVNALI